MASQGGQSYPTRYAMILFPGFQALDVFGPLEVLNLVATAYKLKLYLIASTLDPVSTQAQSMPRPSSIAQSILPTHTLDGPPEDVEVLIIPGGGGTRNIEATQPIIDYIKEVFPKLRYFLTICTGSALAARAGVLDGKRATTNKGAFTWVSSQGPNVTWVRSARWVVDGNVWTSSGISAGIDMTFAFVEAQFGKEVADRFADAAEYRRIVDSTEDPFALLDE